MPTKPLDRLMFAQGGLCFFCRLPLSKTDASVEHLVASAKGGANSDDNCVACCRTLNAMFGCMSLKEKLQLVLNQKGDFRCPNGTKPAKAPPVAPLTTKAKKAPKVCNQEDLDRVIANLQQRGDARPASTEKLTNAIGALFPGGITHGEVATILRQLQNAGKLKIDGAKVTYFF